jgi:NADPH:quinone reductase-like Zn-dependent oxidoreductase
MLAPFVVAEEDALVKIPAYMSYAEAATLPFAALTAWSSLTGPKPIRLGETVLTVGTGGVALFALQFAKLFGARIIALTSMGAKAARLKQLGADEVVNYRRSPTGTSTYTGPPMEMASSIPLKQVDSKHSRNRSVAQLTRGLLTWSRLLGMEQSTPIYFASGS